MSRYANTAIPVPKGVEVKIEKNRITAKGTKGQLDLELKPGVSVEQAEDKLQVSLEKKQHLTPAIHGLYRSLVNNLVVGVSTGFQKRLSLVGVGYRAAVAGNMLDLQLGYSHPTKIEIPSSCKVTVEKSTLIVIEGVDKQVVGQFAATVRAVRPPEPYKGKGVRYEDEYVRKKAGKAAKGKAA